MSFSETDSYYCEICNEQFDIHSLYACYQGHFFCKTCFKQEYYKGKEQRCPHLTCNAWIENAKPSKANHGEPVRISNKMFPQPGLYSENKKLTAQINSASAFSISNVSLLSLSKRPLQCPYKDCNRTIAVSSLDSHFRYEHKHVAFVDTLLEARNGLEFFLDDVKLNEILCIVVINIVGEGSVIPIDSRCDSLRSNTIMPAKPVLIVMASRISLSKHGTNFERAEEEDEFCDCDYYPPSEKIIIWVASNIVTKYSYTLAISTQCNGIRLKYFGPLLTLSEDYKKLCLEGKGLILSSNHNAGMTQNGTKPLVLDILIHNTEEVSNDK